MKKKHRHVMIWQQKGSDQEYTTFKCSESKCKHKTREKTRREE